MATYNFSSYFRGSVHKSQSQLNVDRFQKQTQHEPEYTVMLHNICTQ